MPFTSEELFTKFIELGIITTTIEHPPLRTVEEARQLRIRLDGGQVKNLFLKDKKKRYWLLVALEDTNINLKQTAKQLGTPKLSFASAEELQEILGIVPGAVSPLSIINDVNNLVTIVLDERLTKITPLNFHPLRNDRTTNICTSDFFKFLETTGHKPLIIDFSEVS
jgi:Ala-tRNA(Pro) deacylase